jgi:hypothetical protein
MKGQGTAVDAGSAGEFSVSADGVEVEHAAQTGRVMPGQGCAIETAGEFGNQTAQVTPQVAKGRVSRPRPARTGAAQRPPTSRSAVTNGSRMLVGVNGSSALARRYRDLVEGLTAELGEDLGQAELLMVRNAASLQLHVEDLSAQLARGDAVDPEAFTRAANAATRAISALRKRRPAKRPRGSSLGEYLQQRRGEGA